LGKEKMMAMHTTQAGKGTRKIVGAWNVRRAVITAWFLLKTEGVRSLSSAQMVTSPVVRNSAVPGLKNGMDYTCVGSSDLVVSKVCMGTMTFGKQNTLEEGVEQLNLAFDRYGINILDTAELYPVPSTAETKFRTDETIALFLKGRKREDVVVATKVAGRSERLTFLRENGEETRVSRRQIIESVDASLKRLNTDYIDLIQIHWPDRYVPLFGQPDFLPCNAKDDDIPFQEQLSTFQHLISQGKVRYLGVSNETPYGLCSMISLAQQHPHKYAKVVSIQNSYSLVVRKDFESGLAEPCYYHNVGFLPYSPLAGGVLTGKYSDPQHFSPNARLNLFPGFMDRYRGSQNEAAVKEYCQIAQQVRSSSTQHNPFTIPQCLSHTLPSGRINTSANGPVLVLPQRTCLFHYYRRYLHKPIEGRYREL